MAGLRLVQPSTGHDLTDRMLGFSESFADATAEVDGLLLKSRSPSCGVGDVKVYAGEAPVTGKGRGMFAAVMMARHPHVPAEDEGRLTNAELRHHWLTRVWASARLRAAAERGPAGLVDFHTRYKLVLMAHSPAGQRELGRVVAEAGRSDFPTALARYRAAFAAALTEPASRGANLNAIQHAQGYFKRELGGREKRQFLSFQDEYRAGHVPFQALLAVLENWVERFDEPYLRQQWFFRPYPRALVTAADSGRARLA
ncbi:MAG: YbgA family protein [Gemmatimonadota bacterium]